MQSQKQDNPQVIKKLTPAQLFDALVAAEPEYEKEKKGLFVAKQKRKVDEEKSQPEQKKKTKPESEDFVELAEYIPIIKGMPKRHQNIANEFNHHMRIAVASGRVINESSRLILDFNPITRQVLIERDKTDGTYELVWLPCLTVWKLTERNGNAKHMETFKTFVTEKRQEFDKNHFLKKAWSDTVLQRIAQQVSIASKEQLYFKRPFLGIIPSINSFSQPLIIYQLESPEFLKVKSLEGGKARGITTLESMIEGLMAAAADDSIPKQFRFNIIRLYHFLNMRINQYRGVLINAEVSTYEAAAFLLIYMGMKVKLDEIAEDMAIDHVQDLDEILTDELRNKWWLESFDFKKCDQWIAQIKAKIPEYEQNVKDVFPELNQIIQTDKDIERKVFERCGTLSKQLLAESRKRKNDIHTKNVLARQDPYKEIRQKCMEEELKKISSEASRPSLMSSLKDSLKTLPSKLFPK